MISLLILNPINRQMKKKEGERTRLDVPHSKFIKEKKNKVQLEILIK